MAWPDGMADADSGLKTASDAAMSDVAATPGLNEPTSQVNMKHVCYFFTVLL